MALCDLHECPGLTRPGHFFHVGDAGTVQAKCAVCAPLPNIHLADTESVVRILGSECFRLVQARSEHDINAVFAVGRGSREEQPTGAMLMVEPLTVRFIITLFLTIFFRQRTGQHEIPHIFLPNPGEPEALPY